MTLNTAVVVPMPSAKESTARAGADGRTFLGARHWDDDGSVQRHLRFVSEPLPLARRRPHGASGPSERTRRGLVAWNHWSAAQTVKSGPMRRKRRPNLRDPESYA